MKQFFGAFFGSLVGLIVAVLIGMIMLIAVVKNSITGALEMEPSEPAIVKTNTVLHLVMKGNIYEREIENPFKELQNMGLSREEGLGLNVLLKKIKGAAADEKIKGIYLEMKNLYSSFANITEVRNALKEFKKSGKLLYAYSENMDEKEYYLASVADKVFLNPQGSMEFKGLSMKLLFYKNTFEKLGIDIQTFRHGKYKSAIEPLVLDKMSAANRVQTEQFLGSIWETMLQSIASSRKLVVEDLNKLANTLAIQTPEDAVQNKLIDKAVYEDQVLYEIKTRLNWSDTEKWPVLSIQKYRTKPDVIKSTDKIAVIYANGQISGGEGTDHEIGSDRISKSIKDARLDSKVKAIVLRVNSPGGSALASDVIWREVTLAKKVKPVIVSMGNYAASGGYYISCAATRIFAQPNTITGSIGVFGLLPNVQKALENKLGVTIDTVNTNKFSSMGSPLLSIRDKEKEYLQASVEKIYDVFVSRVSEGRGMSKADVDSLGQGRVWTGTEAVNNGLVDELGGLTEALRYAAKKAGLTDYKIHELPKPKNPIETFLGKSDDEAESRIVKSHLGPVYSYLIQIKSALTAKGIQARLPFEMIFD